MTLRITQTLLIYHHCLTEIKAVDQSPFASVRHNDKGRHPKKNLIDYKCFSISYVISFLNVYTVAQSGSDDVKI